MKDTKALPEARCKKCHVLLYKGRLEGEIKCRSCGFLQKARDLKYNKLQNDLAKN